jgi:hypothetical protein
MSQNTESNLLQSKVVRLTLALFALAVVLLIAGVVTYMAYRASRNKPLKVDTYPGAQLVNSEVVIPNKWEHDQFVSADPIDQIEAFYKKQDMKCSRQYGSVQVVPEQSPVQEGLVNIVCLIDHSALDVTQYTKVTLQPRVDETGSPVGNEIIIDVERHWGE